MMDKTYYNVLLKDTLTPVEGFELTAHFAARKENSHGYRITHLPTGWLLTEMGFSSLKLARTFAELIEGVFGSLLSRQDVRLLRDAARINFKYDLYHRLILEMNEVAENKKVVTDSDMNEIVDRVINGQQVGEDS